MARLSQNDKVIHEIPLRYAGVTSTFAEKISAETLGKITLEVLAMDASNANFGSVKSEIEIY